MQKLRATNKIIIVISNIVELILINYFINSRFQYNLSSNPEGFLRVNLVLILLDIIYFLILFDLIYVDNDKAYNPLKIYKKEANFVNVMTFLPYHILKVVILFFILPKSIFLYSYYYNKIILCEMIPLFMFYILYCVFPKRDNVFKKSRVLKDALRYYYSGTYNFINVHGEFSTFHLNQRVAYKIHEKNIYINDKDLSYLKEKGYKIEKFAKNCITCEVHYLKTDDLKIIRKVLEKTELEDFKKIYIFVVNNKNNIKDNEINASNAIKIVNKKEEIEYIENLLLQERYSSVSTEE